MAAEASITSSPTLSVDNTVIRDCIHGLVIADEKVREILDTPVLQRLRWIRQMGLSSFVFPSAEHSRFAHALGSYAVAQRAFRKLMDITVEYPSFFNFPFQLDDDGGRVLGIAALCHDIGHTAFSHALEDASLFPHGIKDHETCGKAIFRNDSSFRKTIRNYCDVDAIEQVYAKSHPIMALSQLVSSMYDVDKCDYLLRDSYHLGVQYGAYDLSWLIHLMSLSYDDYVLVFDGTKATDALRQFLQARKSMYFRIYLHPTIRAAQMLLRAIFRRASEVLSANDRKLLPTELRSAVDATKERTLGEFKATTDRSIINMVEEFSRHARDPILRNFSKSFLARDFFKSVIDTTRLVGATEFQPGTASTDNLITEIRDIVGTKMVARYPAAKSLQDYFVVLDHITIPPVSISDVYLRFGVRLHYLSDIAGWGREYDFSDFTQEHQIDRLYVPEFARPAVEDHLRQRGFPL